MSIIRTEHILQFTQIEKLQHKLPFYPRRLIFNMIMGSISLKPRFTKIFSQCLKSYSFVINGTFMNFIESVIKFIAVAVEDWFNHHTQSSCRKNIN